MTRKEKPERTRLACPRCGRLAAVTEADASCYDGTCQDCRIDFTACWLLGRGRPTYEVFPWPGTDPVETPPDDYGRWFDN